MTTPTPATRENVEALIDRLVDKTLSFGLLVRELVSQECEVGIYLENSQIFYKCHGVMDSGDLNDPNIYKILGHPILIGDVLEKMGKDVWEDLDHWGVDFDDQD